MLMGRALCAFRATANYFACHVRPLITPRRSYNILERFSLPSLPGFEPHYNIAPTQLQWSIIRDGNGAPEVRQLKWGLVPSWANDPSVGNRMINARAESLTEKPSFRESLQTRQVRDPRGRLLRVEVGGQEKGSDVLPPDGGKGFRLGGIVGPMGNGDTLLETCTVITTDAGASKLSNPSPHASSTGGRRHDKMDGRFSAGSPELRTLLAPYDRDDLELYEVSAVRQQCRESIPRNASLHFSGADLATSLNE
jgi:putative SOS response-associated peptidase YedK